ncbi:hypothetical protein SKA58_08294 [Sphingomonas sp. SKA58]|nr:hypothetical protein SKA58_08294 [Sphingomonas sp. SKA58]
MPEMIGWPQVGYFSLAAGLSL